jgi:hypothetical protein
LKLNKVMAIEITNADGSIWMDIPSGTGAEFGKIIERALRIGDTKPQSQKPPSTPEANLTRYQEVGVYLGRFGVDDFTDVV